MTVFHRIPPPWFESVKDLKPGGKRRLGDGFLASFNGRAYQRYDFREKESEVYEPQMTLAERMAISKIMREAETSAIQSNEMPPTMAHPRDWPVQARAWLHKAGLTNDDITMHLQAGWSPEMQRVVIPTPMLDGTMGWIARTLQESRDNPKYLFPKGMRRGGGALVTPMIPRSVVVISEDILSSYRIEKDTGYASVSALGTSLDRDAITLIAGRYSTAILWLDPDHYGQLGARTIRKQLSQLGVRTANILSERDPKLHSPGEIEIYVDDALKAAR